MIVFCTAFPAPKPIIFRCHDDGFRFIPLRFISLYPSYFAKSVSAKYNDGEFYSAVYTRDKLGRIETKTETVEGGTEILYEYGCDLAGRLETVKENGILTEQYGHDDNGNRTHLDGKLDWRLRRAGPARELRRQRVYLHRQRRVV